MTCPLCAQTPKGIDGHDGIVMDQRTGRPKARAMFRCVNCGETYFREYEGSGEFAWISVSGAQPQ